MFENAKSWLAANHSPISSLENSYLCNMRQTIDITTILGFDLKSRSTVGDLSLFIENTNAKDVAIDFGKVEFVTRSFIDEFYNTFLKNKNSMIHIALVNVSDDIQRVLDVVSQTQHKKKEISKKSSVVTFSNIDEVNHYLKTLPI